MGVNLNRASDDGER